MTRVRRLLAALPVVMVLLLAGCGGIPASSPVIEGRRVDEPILDPPVRVVPQDPFAGATQEQIALGFLRAGEDADETRDTAKSYLSPGSVDLWRWSSKDIVIYDSPDDVSVRTVAQDTLEVRTRAVATVSPEGRYTDLPAGTEVSVTFGMTQVGGEWRIELPRTGFGLWLESSGFDRLYAAHNVFYVTRTDRQLVPDTRWFPSGSRMATTLARAQLAPPPPHLAGALTTGIPEGTSLAVNAVPVENGRAQVTLSEQALDADPQERTAMWAQLAATLSQVSAVQSVSIRAGGTDLELPTLGATVSVFADLGFERSSLPSFDTALLRSPRDGRIARVDPGFIPDPSANERRPDTKERDGDPAAIPRVWIDLAQSADGREVAAVGDNRRDLSRWRGADFFTVRSFASQLTQPTYDTKGYLWVGGRDANGAGGLFAMDASEAPDEATRDQVPEMVTAPWLRNRKVVDVAVAADAARLLVVTTDRRDQDAQLVVAGVLRDANGSPTALGEPLRLAQPLTRIDDVVWLSEGSYAVLGRIASEPLRPWLGEIGAGLDGMRRHGPVTAEAARVSPLPEGSPVALTSVGGPRGIVVISDRDVAWGRAGATWHQIGSGRDLLVPGR